MIDGIKAKEFIITPNCRALRSSEGAIDFVLDQIEEEYNKLLEPEVNKNSKIHVVLTVDRD